MADRLQERLSQLNQQAADKKMLLDKLAQATDVAKADLYAIDGATQEIERLIAEESAPTTKQ